MSTKLIDARTVMTTTTLQLPVFAERREKTPEEREAERQADRIDARAMTKLLGTADFVKTFDVFALPKPSGHRITSVNGVGSLAPFWSRRAVIAWREQLRGAAALLPKA